MVDPLGLSGGIFGGVDRDFDFRGASAGGVGHDLGLEAHLVAASLHSAHDEFTRLHVLERAGEVAVDEDLHLVPGCVDPGLGDVSGCLDRLREGREVGRGLEFLPFEKGEVAVADLQEDLAIIADLHDAEVVELPFALLAEKVEHEKVVRHGRAGFVAEVRFSKVGGGGGVAGGQHPEGHESPELGCRHGIVEERLGKDELLRDDAVAGFDLTGKGGGLLPQIQVAAVHRAAPGLVGGFERDADRVVRLGGRQVFRLGRGRAGEEKDRGRQEEGTGELHPAMIPRTDRVAQEEIHPPKKPVR